MEDVINVGFKCPRNVRDKFKQYAKTQDRTMKDQIIHMMRKAVDDCEEKPPNPD